MAKIIVSTKSCLWVRKAGTHWVAPASRLVLEDPRLGVATPRVSEHAVCHVGKSDTNEHDAKLVHGS